MSLQQQGELAVICEHYQLPERVREAVVRDFGRNKYLQSKLNNKRCKARMWSYLQHRGIG